MNSSPMECNHTYLRAQMGIYYIPYGPMFVLGLKA